MNRPGFEKWHRPFLITDKQRDLGTTQDDSSVAAFDKARDHLAITLPRRNLDAALHQFLIDYAVHNCSVACFGKLDLKHLALDKSALVEILLHIEGGAQEINAAQSCCADMLGGRVCDVQ